MPKLLKKDRKYATVLGVRIDSTSKNQALITIGSKLRQETKFYIVTPNPEIILAAQKDSELRNILNKADLSLPDGFGLTLASGFLGQAKLTTIQGRKVMLFLFKMAQRMKLKIFLLGSRKKVIEKSLRLIKKDYPGLEAAGISGPALNINADPISKLDETKEREAIEQINKFCPDILFVAFGAPKQEKWIAKWYPRLKIRVAMVVGGALDYFSGETKLPPAYLEKLHLEWLWRLITEPARFGRIFNALVVFPLTVLMSTSKRENAS